MIERRYSLTMDASHEIESLIERFEQDRREQSVDLHDYLPAEGDPAYGAVVTELSRIDLEHAFDCGQVTEASSYINAFPEVFKDDGYRAQLVFEEYRLRRWAGEPIEASQLAERYAVDASRWPKLKAGSQSNLERERTCRKYDGNQPSIPATHYPRVGDTFAGYPLIDRLGEGAFSRVFLARQPDLAGRSVVLKITPLATDESDRLARLQHTAIIPIYSVHRDADLSCICMPFLGVITLADMSTCGERWASLEGPAQELVSTILERKRSTIHSVKASGSESGNEPVGSTDAREPSALKHASVDSCSVQHKSHNGDESIALKQLSRLGYVEALLTLVTGAVEGLAHAHQHGVVHRDLKPANILVSDEGSPILLDFNLAIDSHEPKTRIVGGTLPYMSPQQLASLETGEAVDTSDDVFSVGVILYELLSGQLPFKCPKGGEAFELVSLIDDRRRKPPSLQTLNRGVSVGLESIINRCFAPDRADRYQDASELLEDLNRHCQHRPLRFAPNQSLIERLSKWSARHPRMSSASSVATIAAMLLMLCGFLIHHRGERIASLNADANRQELLAATPSVIAALSTPGRETEILQDGLNQSSQVLTSWLRDDQISTDSGFRYLDEASQQSVRRELAQLAYLMAEAEADVGLQRTGDETARDLHRQRSLQWNQISGHLVPSLSPLTDQQSKRIAAKYEGQELTPMSSEDLESLQPDLRTMAAAESGDAALLLELSREQLQLQPSNVSLWFYWSVANARMGRWQSAIAGLDVCDSIRPSSLATLFNRGLCHLQVGNAAAARDDFTACLAIRPEMMTARFNLAVADERLGNLESARSNLNQLVKSDRATTRMWLMRASVNQRLGNLPAAFADRERSMTIPPRDPSDWVARGVNRLTNSPDKALEDFLAALHVDPNDFHALQNAAHVYGERLNDPTRAIEMLDRLVTAWPNDASAFASRGILHARIGQVEPAIADAEAASVRQPGPREQLQIAGIYALVSAELSDEAVVASKHAKATSLQWLRRALRHDAALGETARGDSDLAAVMKDDDFRRLIESAKTLELNP